MAKIETINKTGSAIIKKNKSKKRKIKDVLSSVHDIGGPPDSPTGKFRKLTLDILDKKSTMKISSKTKQLTTNNTEISVNPNKNNNNNIAQTTTTKIENRKSKKRNLPENYTSNKKFKASSTDSELIMNKKRPNNDNQDDADDVDQDHVGKKKLYEPSYYEIMESTKNENQIQIETIREKKRKTHQKLIDDKQKGSVDKEYTKNLAYLQNWNDNQQQQQQQLSSNWKFEKLRQISIQNHLFDDGFLTEDNHWTIALNYVSGTKGAGREQLIKKAETIINEIDGKINDANHTEMTSLKSYNRARELLQLLQ